MIQSILGVDLDKIEKTDQMNRYLPVLNILILEDYFDFRWNVKGKERLRVKEAEVDAAIPGWLLL